MNFEEKFNMIISVVEENLSNEYRDYKGVTKALERKLGVPSRVISDTFNFVTDVTLGNYILKRKLAAAYDFKIRNQCKWEDAAEKYGYSEASALRRAFKKAYGVTLAEQGDESKNIKLMKPFSLEDVLRGQNVEEKKMREEKLQEERAYGYYGNIEVEADKYNAVQQISFRPHNDEERDLIFDIIECQSLFGIDLSMVMLVHSMLEDTGKLYIACECASRAFAGRTAESLTDMERKVLYFVINWEMEEYEARQMTEIFRDVPVERLKEFSAEYLMVTGAIAQYRRDNSEVVPYPVYLKLREIVGAVVDRERMKERLEEDIFLRETGFFWDYEGVDDIMEAALRSVLQAASKGEIEALAGKEKIAKRDEDILFLMVHYSLKKETAEWITEHVAPLVSGDVRQIDHLYLKMVESGEKRSTVRKDYQRFNELKKEALDRGYEQDVESVLFWIFVSNMTLDQAIEKVDDVNRVKQLSDDYDLEVMKIRFAERISNAYVGTEDAYRMMQNTYSEKEYFGVKGRTDSLSSEDKLALILRLNTGKEISECEKEVKEILRGKELQEEELDEYLNVNMYGSSDRKTDDFSLISVDKYREAKKTAKDTELDTPFFLWVILYGYQSGKAASITESFQIVSKKYEERKREGKEN